MKTSKYILASLLFIPLISSAQKNWTLQQCVDTAWANNRNIKQQALTKKSREIAYEQARNNLLPNLNASMNQNWNFGRSLTVDNTYKSTNSAQTSFGISSNITLFDGLKMKYSIDARKAEMLASEANLLKIQNDIAVSVSSAFLQVLLNKELSQIAKDQLELTKKKIDQRRIMVANGKLAEGELFELMAQQAKEEQNIVQTSNNLKLSLLDLAQIMEIRDFENLDIELPVNLLESELNLLSADAVYESAITHRPEIKSAEYSLKSSQTEVLISKSSYYPTLSLGAQMGTGYYNMSNVQNQSFGRQLSDNLSKSLGLSLSIPIFNRYSVKNSVRNAMINVESNRLNMENARLELKKSIQQAYYNAIGAKSKWEAATKSVDANKEAFRFANEKYEVGRATSYELYQAKTNLTQALSEQAQAKYEYVFRIKLLELLK